MNALRTLLVVTLALAGCDSPTVTDAGPGVDAGATIDAAPDLDAGPAACSGGQPDVSGIVNTEGLIVARDGAVYYSQPGGRVGRMLPGESPDDLWTSLGSGASTVWGMVLSADNSRLYVGAPNAGLFEVATDGSADPELVVSGGAYNGVTLSPDGRIYYSDFGAGEVWVFDPSSRAATQVTTSPIASANGVIFRADGVLLVASYSTGTLFALTLDSAGLEASRESFASTGLGSPDGLLLDTEQRVYVSDNSGGRLLRLPADGSGSPEVLLQGLSAPASIEAGAGALNCGDLYVANQGSGGLARYSGEQRVQSAWQ